MKFLTLLFFITLTFNARAFERSQAQSLLASRALSLESLERQGGQLFLGEVTGAGRTLNAQQLRVIFMQDRVILKEEVESISFKKQGNKLADIDSFRAHGLYYTAEDIQGVLITK